MIIAVPNETHARERRVALVPDVIRTLSAKGHDVHVEPGAGAGARIPDALFDQAGALSASGTPAMEDAGVVVRVRAPSLDAIERLSSGSTLLAFLAPLTSPETTL